MKTDVDRRFVRIALAAGVIATILISPTAVTRASDGSDVAGDFLSTTEDRIADLIAWVRGKVDRARSSFSDDGLTPEESADETAEIFNDNSGTLVDYANDRLDSSRDKTDFDVIRIDFEKEDDPDATRYIVATVNETADEYENASMVASTDRSVDEWVEIRDQAVNQVPDELDRFVDTFVEDDEPVDRAYAARLCGRYSPDVDTSLEKSCP